MTTTLSPEQEAVASALTGPLLVSASAGSGKTTTLAERIRRLLEAGVPAQEILAITFTNKAGRELSEKIHRRAGRTIPWVGTFHGLSARLLRQYWDSGFVVLDETDAKSLFRSVCRSKFLLDGIVDTGMGKRDETDLCDKAYEEMSGARDRGISLKKLLDDATPSSHIELCERAWAPFLLAMSDLRALDFCGILEAMIMVCKREPELRWRFEYLQVDEYQDTNQLQDQIVMLLGEHGNVCAVGDEKQSIYGWRGANIDNFRRFPERWPNCQQLSLSVNYRSRPAICTAAERLMKSATDLSYPAAVRPDRAGQGGSVGYAASNPDEEAYRIVKRIVQLQDNGRRLSDCAILYRAHLLSLPIERHLIDQGIPYKVLGGLGLLQRAAAKDILAYLRLIARPQDDLAFDRAVKAPPRGLGPAALAAVRESYPDEPMLKALTLCCGRPDILKPAARTSAAKFARLFAHSLTATATEAIDMILDESGLMDETRPVDDRQAVRTIGDELRRLCAGGMSIELLLEQVALQSGEDEDKGDCVVLTTMHGAKGLEWGVVFAPGWDEGTFPSPRSDLEEERRLAYVTITRARDELYVGWPRFRRDGGDREPSRFLTECGLLVA